MTHNTNPSTKKEKRIKFLVPDTLKDDLQYMARERNVSLSALMRLITSEYVKRHQTQ